MIITAVIEMNSQGSFHMMIRKIGFALAASAGVLMAGSGIAAADETTPDPTPTAPSAGSADSLAALLQGLLGGGTTPTTPTTPDPVADPATPDPTAPSTGSATLLPLLLSGSAEAPAGNSAG